jgi:hypothetical protein
LVSAFVAFDLALASSALARVLRKLGIPIAIRIPIMRTTTISSIRVNAASPCHPR